MNLKDGMAAGVEGSAGLCSATNLKYSTASSTILQRFSEINERLLFCSYVENAIVEFWS